jgi:hypothetical protein
VSGGTRAVDVPLGQKCQPCVHTKECWPLLSDEEIQEMLKSDRRFKILWDLVRAKCKALVTKSTIEVDAAGFRPKTDSIRATLSSGMVIEVTVAFCSCDVLSAHFTCDIRSVPGVAICTVTSPLTFQDVDGVVLNEASVPKEVPKFLIRIWRDVVNNSYDNIVCQADSFMRAGQSTDLLKYVEQNGAKKRPQVLRTGSGIAPVSYDTLKKHILVHKSAADAAEAELQAHQAAADLGQSSSAFDGIQTSSSRLDDILGMASQPTLPKVKTGQKQAKLLVNKVPFDKPSAAKSKVLIYIC